MANESDVSFTIREIGDITGETWAGEFRAKTRLSHRDHLKKDQLRRELLGPSTGISPTDRALSTAMIISELAVRLTKTPKWWVELGNGLDLEDDLILGVIFDKAMKIEREALEERKKRASEAQGELREEAAKESDKG